MGVAFSIKGRKFIRPGWWLPAWRGLLYYGEKFLDRICSRLAASRSFTIGIHLYAYPAGTSFCSCKRKQNTLGAVPQDPLTLKLRLDTNDAKHRPYSAADTLSRCLRRILIWFLQTNRRKYRCRAYELNERLFAQTAPPPPRGRGTGWGQMLPQATFGAHLCAVRIWIFRPRKI